MSDTGTAQPGASGSIEKRERWDSRTAFIMASIGSAVGLGNVWRFPAVAYENGGGAFFIPYFVALLTAGIPLLILEFSIGQMMQSSAPGSLKKLNKNFEWVGWFALLVGTVISIYYAAIMAYSWGYLWDSISSVSPPWSGGGAGSESTYFYDTFLKFGQDTDAALTFNWPVIIGLALTWVAVFLIIYKGVHRVSKIVMVTVPLPFIILVILAIRGMTLEGASAGLEYYLRPDFEALKKPATWLAAYGQIFFSLTLGFGVMIAYASYRPRRSDVTNNAFITSFANCLTSFIAGFAVFSILGFLAFKNGVPVNSVVADGPGLAFVTYPAAISKMGDLGAFWPPLIGFLFFIALLTLGIDSLFSLVEAIGAGFHERFPKINRKHLAAAVCGFCFIVGFFTMGTNAGLGWVDLLDHWANGYGLVVVGLLQCLLVGYFYNTHRIRDFADDVSELKLSGWWELCIKVITPLVLVYLLSTAIIDEFATPYGASYVSWMQWTCLIIFLGLFAVAFGMTKRWSHLILAGSALVVGLVVFAIVRPASVEPEAESKALRGGDAREVAFDANVSGVGEPYVVMWDFGDGTTSTELNPTHTYSAPGEYTALLRVRGEDGRGSAAEDTVKVEALPLSLAKVEVAKDRSLHAATNSLAFRYSAEAVAGEEPYSFTWKFGEGIEKQGDSGKYVFPQSRNYTVTVTVTDASNQTSSQDIQVAVKPFTVVLSADPRGGEVPAKVSFEADIYSGSGTQMKADDFKFEWDFGDTHRSDSPGAVQHRYDLERSDDSGDDNAPAHSIVKRTASVTVRAGDGQYVTDQVEISLRPPEKHAPGRAAFLGAFAAALLVGGLVFTVMLASRHAKSSTPSEDTETLG